MLNLSLSISNIAWPHDLRKRVYAELKNEGVHGVEVAPTKFAEWDEMNDGIADTEGKLIADHGLTVASYQSILFGKPELQLLGGAQSFSRMLEHLKRFSSFAHRLSGGGYAVFGAPKNRLRNGLEEDDAFFLAVERFRVLADMASDFDVVWVLEPAPAFYGGNFLVTTEECAAMVRAVDHPSFRLHLDLGCAAIEQSNTRELILRHRDLVSHVQLSRPNLVPFVAEQSEVTDLIAALSEAVYRGSLAIEMRETDDPISTIQRCVRSLPESWPRKFGR